MFGLGLSGGMGFTTFGTLSVASPTAAPPIVSADDEFFLWGELILGRGAVLPEPAPVDNGYCMYGELILGAC